MRPADNISKSFKKLHVPTSAQLDKKIYDATLEEMDKYWEESKRKL